MKVLHGTLRPFTLLPTTEEDKRILKTEKTLLLCAFLLFFWMYVHVYNVFPPTDVKHNLKT